jgi:serine/threonine-protein kinase
MSADPTTVMTTDVWSTWEDHVVNGIFPLRRFLGGSDHSAVFLTECRAYGLAEATIKLIPADTVRAADQLAHWRAAAALSHPNLVQILDVGRCELGGRELLFVVTEYAEQTLAEVLARRALSADEARELFRPALEALAFLHQKGLVHSRLKPSNLLAVNDQLKIAGDTVRAVGAPASDVVTASVYDAPELRGGKMSLASDIWALGAIIVEALTQRAPVWADSLRESVRLPANLPLSFAGIVRRCLATSPAQRPTAHELLAPFKSVPQIQVISTPLPPVREGLVAEHSRLRGSSAIMLSLVTLGTAFVVFLVAWVAMRSPS